MNTILKWFFFILLSLCIANGAFAHKRVITTTVDTLILKAREVKTGLGDEVKIKYDSYSHEHSSSSPNEPFEASVGVYNFELTANKVTETITIYLGVNQNASAVDWKQYKITLFSASPDQKEVKVGISPLK